MKGLKFTKRGAMRIIEKNHDPLNIILRFAVRAKILFHDISKKKLDRDNALPRDLTRIFQDFCEELFYLKRISVPRHLLSMNGI